jgi:lysophospholipase L1-like esterase
MNKPLLPLLTFIALSSTNLWAQTPATNSAAGNPAIQPATRSNPTNWMSRHEGFVELAKKGGVDLLFLGDSITDNWRKAGKAVWDKSYGSRNAANFGIGGDRTQHVLWRIENGELVGIKPKVVVLMIGTNNSNSDSGDQIAEGVEKIVQVIHAKLPASKVLLLAIFPRNKPADKPEQLEHIKQANARIAKLDNGKTVRFVDLNSKFLGADGKVPADIMPDFLHPNEKGYEIWAEAMEPALAAMLR